jgi:hypothetical protein
LCLLYVVYMFIVYFALQSGVDGWSVPDLVHAVVILAHFHSLCGFVFGCAVNPEPDSDFGVAWGMFVCIYVFMNLTHHFML